MIPLNHILDELTSLPAFNILDELGYVWVLSHSETSEELELKITNKKDLIISSKDKGLTSKYKINTNNNNEVSILEINRIKKELEHLLLASWNLSPLLVHHKDLKEQYSGFIMPKIYDEMKKISIFKLLMPPISKFYGVQTIQSWVSLEVKCLEHNLEIYPLVLDIMEAEKDSNISPSIQFLFLNEFPYNLDYSLNSRGEKVVHKFQFEQFFLDVCKNIVKPQLGKAQPIRTSIWDDF